MTNEGDEDASEDMDDSSQQPDDVDDSSQQPTNPNSQSNPTPPDDPRFVIQYWEKKEGDGNSGEFRIHPGGDDEGTPISPDR